MIPLCTLSQPWKLLFSFPPCCKKIYCVSKIKAIFSEWMKWGYCCSWYLFFNQMLPSITGLCNCKATCQNPYISTEKEKRSIYHWMMIAPTIAFSWASTDVGNLEVCLFPCVFWISGYFSSFTQQRHPIDSENGNPGGWSLVLFPVQTCCSSSSRFASVSPFPPWSGLDGAPRCLPGQRGTFPYSPLSPHPRLPWAPQGSQEGQFVDAGSGLAALRWR